MIEVREIGWSTFFTRGEQEAICYALNHHKSGKYPLVTPTILDTIWVKYAFDSFTEFISAHDFTKEGRNRNSIIYEKLEGLMNE